jgi:dienelactone hydrolase
MAGAQTEKPPSRQAAPLWSHLEAGKYEVGLRQLHGTDPGRPFGNGTRPRVLQVLLWYPATESGRPTSYEDYFHLAASELASTEPSAEEAAEHLLDVRGMALESGADACRFDAFLKTRARARLGAKPVKERFPLVVFSPGSGAPAFQNTVVCEYLTSHGFLVAASPSVGPVSRRMPGTTEGLEAQAADIRLAIDTVARLDIAPPEKVGLFGLSWGGMAVLLQTMNDDTVDAVAALDPTVMVKRGRLLGKRVPGFRPDRLTVPTIFMIAAAKEWKERDVSFFDELGHTESALLRFGDFTHGDFASIIVQFFVATKPGHDGRDLDRIGIGYSTMCRYLLAFFSARLKDDSASEEFLMARPDELGIPEGVVEIQRNTMMVAR